MKKITTLLLAVFLVTGVAQANFYSDNNPADVWINALNPSYTGMFTLAGYNPAAETITYAHAEFTLWDLVGNESVKIDMGGDILTHGSFFGTLSLGTDVINAWLVLDSTGALSYTVSRSSGGLSEFWLKNAYLGAETVSRNVPDGGATSALLGLGMLLMVGVKRRFRTAA